MKFFTFNQIYVDREINYVSIKGGVMKTHGNAFLHWNTTRFVHKLYLTLRAPLVFLMGVWRDPVGSLVGWVSTSYSVAATAKRQIEEIEKSPALWPPFHWRLLQLWSATVAVSGAFLASSFLLKRMSESGCDVVSRVLLKAQMRPRARKVVEYAFDYKAPRAHTRAFLILTGLFSTPKHHPDYFTRMILGLAGVEEVLQDLFVGTVHQRLQAARILNQMADLFEEKQYGLNRVTVLRTKAREINTELGAEDQLMKHP